MRQFSQSCIRSISRRTYDRNLVPQAGAHPQFFSALEQKRDFTRCLNVQEQNSEKIHSVGREAALGLNEDDHAQHLAAIGKNAHEIGKIAVQDYDQRPDDDLPMKALSSTTKLSAETSSEGHVSLIENEGPYKDSSDFLSQTQVYAPFDTHIRPAGLIEREVKKLASVLPPNRNLPAWHPEAENQVNRFADIEEFGQHLKERIKNTYEENLRKPVIWREPAPDVAPKKLSRVERKQVRELTYRRLYDQKKANLSNVNKDLMYSYDVDADFKEIIDLITSLLTDLRRVKGMPTHERISQGVLSKQGQLELQTKRELISRLVNDNRLDAEKLLEEVEHLAVGIEHDVHHDKADKDSGAAVQVDQKSPKLGEIVPEPKPIPNLSFTENGVLPKFPLSRSELGDFMGKLVTPFIPQLHSSIVPLGTSQLDIRQHAIVRIILDRRHMRKLSYKVFEDAISFLASKGRLRAARVLFLYMYDIDLYPNRAIFHFLLEACSRTRDLHNFLFFLHIMVQSTNPTSRTWGLLVNACQTMDQKMIVLQTLDSLGVNTKISLSGSFYGVAATLLAQARGVMADVPKFFQFDFEQQIDECSNLTIVRHMIELHLRKGEDEQALRLLDKAFLARGKKPDVGVMTTFISMQRKRSRLRSIIALLRDFEEKYQTIPDQACFHNLFRCAFETNAYNVGRVVWRHAAMTAMLNNEMMGQMVSQMAGSTKSEFGKFCIGINLVDVPQLIEDNLWSLEIEDVKWPASLLQLPEEELALTHKSFNVCAMEIRFAILKDDYLSCMDWYPAKSLLTDLEAAMEMDIEWGWGHIRSNDDEIYTRHLRKDLNKIKGNKISTNMGYVVGRKPRVDNRLSPSAGVGHVSGALDLKSEAIKEMDNLSKQVVKLDT